MNSTDDIRKADGDQASREIITYEYRFEDTPRFCAMDETWELYDVFPAKWHPGNKVLIFRRELKPLPGLRPNNDTAFNNLALNKSGGDDDLQ